MSTWTPRLTRWMMETLGNEWAGNANPPRDHRTLYVYDDGLYRVFATDNDGYEVGIGYPDKWQVFISWKAARMFAWWVLKTWVADWFGFRTYLWYRALFRSVKGRWEKPRKHPKSVWKSSYDAWSYDAWEKMSVKNDSDTYD